MPGPCGYARVADLVAISPLLAALEAVRNLITCVLSAWRLTHRELAMRDMRICAMHGAVKRAVCLRRETWGQS